MNNLLETWTQALGWALVHSLWQFGLIGLIATILLRIFRRYSANLRYQFVTGALLLAFAIFSFTIGWQLLNKNKQLIDNQKFVFNNVIKDNGQTIYTPKLVDIEPTPLEIGRNWLRDHLYWLVLAWLIGVLVFSVRFGANYLFLNYLRYEGNQPADTAWQNKLRQLKKQMGIAKAVHLLESVVVKAPMTFGHFKPVILVPLGMLASLPPDQVEALLLHELAHIRRHDFLINLLVGVLETLLFYHPAIWWLSARLRELREECCDDLVVAQGTSRLAYAESLLAISQTSKIQLAMNATNQSSHFSLRIRRLLMPETPPQLPRPAVSVLVAILFIVTTAFGSLFAQDDLVVSVAADRMNVLYIGVDNPITVAVAGISNDNIQVSSEDVTVLPQGDGKYILQATKPGEVKVKVESQGKLLKETVFRVKRVPDPVGMVGSKNGGTVMVYELQEQKEMIALLENFDFDAYCEIVSFNVIKISRRNDPVEVANQGNTFGEQTLELFRLAAPGDTYIIRNIKAKCPGDMAARLLDNIMFEVK